MHAHPRRHLLKMPSQTPFLSLTIGGSWPSHGFYIGVEVGRHLFTLIYIMIAKNIKSFIHYS